MALDDQAVTEDDTSSLDDDGEAGDRFTRYRRQCRERGLLVPTWGEYIHSGMPLFEDD